MSVIGMREAAGAVAAWVGLSWQEAEVRILHSIQKGDTQAYGVPFSGHEREPLDALDWFTVWPDFTTNRAKHWFARNCASWSSFAAHDVTLDIDGLCGAFSEWSQARDVLCAVAGVDCPQQKKNGKRGRQRKPQTAIALAAAERLLFERPDRCFGSQKEFVHEHLAPAVRARTPTFNSESFRRCKEFLRLWKHYQATRVRPAC